jgi:hypothetical protein
VHTVVIHSTKIDDQKFVPTKSTSNRDPSMLVLSILTKP